MRSGDERSSARAPRSMVTLVVLVGLSLLLTAALLGLASWQLQRRVWKLDLIARVEQRVHAPPAPGPGPAQWPDLRADKDSYRKVRLTGVFEPGKTTLVQAVTEQGPGFWVMAPFKTRDGFTVLVNRGFAPPDQRAAVTRPDALPQGSVAVTGLLRLTEPKGGFLRANDPQGDRWYSRDVPAIAQAKGLGEVAPYFVDADATPNPGGWPLGGLTVIRFPNSHLVYAITWFGLALMTAGAGVYLLRDAFSSRRGSGDAAGR